MQANVAKACTDSYLDYSLVQAFKRPQYQSLCLYSTADIQIKLYICLKISGNQRNKILLHMNTET